MSNDGTGLPPFSGAAPLSFVALRVGSLGHSWATVPSGGGVRVALVVPEASVQARLRLGWNVLVVAGDWFARMGEERLVGGVRPPAVSCGLPL